MTNAPPPASAEAAQTELLAALARNRWMTAREVWQRIPTWHVTAVRRGLAVLADDGAIEVRVAGTADRPVREYRRR